MIGGVDDDRLVSRPSAGRSSRPSASRIFASMPMLSERRRRPQRSARPRHSREVGRIGAHMVDASQACRPELLGLRDIFLERRFAVGERGVDVVVLAAGARRSASRSIDTRPSAERIPQPGEMIARDRRVNCRTDSASPLSAAASRGPLPMTAHIWKAVAGAGSLHLVAQPAIASKSPRCRAARRSVATSCRRAATYPGTRSTMSSSTMMLTSSSPQRRGRCAPASSDERDRPRRRRGRRGRLRL